MEHRRLSWYLKLAGVLAAAGGGFLFFVEAPIQAGQCRQAYPELAHLYGLALLYTEIIGLVYVAAMVHYFLICGRIGRDRSFCRENARDLRRIAYLMLGAAALWLGGIGVGALCGALGAWWVAAALAAMASAAMGVLALALGRLLGRAVQLQEENELTI